MIARRIWFCLLVVFVLLVSIPVKASEMVDRIVAVVNGEIVTLFELDEQLKPLMERYRGRTLNEQEKVEIRELKKKLLALSVDSILLQQEAKRLGVNVADTEVKGQVQQMKKKQGVSDAQFNKMLLLEGLTIEQYEKKIRDDIIKHRLLGFQVQRKVVVTEEEIQAYYSAHQAEYQKPKTVQLKWIVLAPGKDGKGLRDDILSGKVSFEDAAKKNSMSPDALQGGDLGELNWNDLAVSWRSILDKLQPGEVSEPLEFENGVALLKLVSVTEGQGRSLDDVRDAIVEKLYRPKLEARFQEYMQGLRGKAVIEVRL